MTNKKRSESHPLCDYYGKCKNKAYREVYPSLMGGKHKGEGWSYLCRKHYYQEEKRLKNKLPSARMDPCYKNLRGNKKSSVLRPKYVDKLKRIKKQKGIHFKSTDNLRKAIKNFA